MKNNKQRAAFDIELMPDINGDLFFCFIAKLENKFIVFEISKRKDLSVDLFEFLTQSSNVVFYGYNSNNYDKPVLNALIFFFKTGLRGEQLLKETYEVADSVFDKNKSKDIYNEVKHDKWFESEDLMTITYQNKMQKSLKMVGIILKHKKVQDLVSSFDDYDLVIKYCKNDVEITDKLLQKSLGKINLREDITAKYNTNVNSLYDSEIAKTLFFEEYIRKTGANRDEVAQLRTFQEEIVLGDIIPNDIVLRNSHQLNELKKKKITIDRSVTLDEKQESLGVYKTIQLSHLLGLGGIHSIHKKGQAFYQDDKNLLIDVDFGSYYPWLVINHGLAPRHLDKKAFIDLLVDLTNQRMQAKADSKKYPERKDELETIVSRVKIIINSVYGLLGYENGFLYDEVQRLTVCIIGQLYILELIEWLESIDNKIYCFQSNTDGATFVVPRELEQQFLDLANKYSEKVSIPLEFAYINKFFLRDVNNYVLELVDGKIKEKGAYLTTIDLLKGYSAPVVSKAAQEYLLKGTPILETFEKADILDFCYSQKFDKRATIEFETLKNGVMNVQTLQKTNRWYASLSFGIIWKIDLYEGKWRKSRVLAKSNAALLNDYEPDKSNLNIDYYLSEVDKLIEDFGEKKKQKPTDFIHTIW